MEGRGPLRSDPAFVKLQEFFDASGAGININSEFKKDPERFNKFSKTLKTPNDGDILFDFSKNRITSEVMDMLLELAKSRNLEAGRDAMFAGTPINFTEARAVLHIALRNRSNDPIRVGGTGDDVMPKVNAVLDHMKEFTKVNAVLDHMK